MEIKARLAELEDKIENGTLVELPCKVDDEIYRIGQDSNGNYKLYDAWWVVMRIEVYGDEIVIVDDSDNVITIEDIGKTVFFTKEEAEKKLEELNNEQNS